MNFIRGRGLFFRCCRYWFIIMFSLVNLDVLWLNVGWIICKATRLLCVMVLFLKVVWNRLSFWMMFMMMWIYMCVLLIYNNFVSGVCVMCFLLLMIFGLWIWIVLLLKVLMMVWLVNFIWFLIIIVFVIWFLFCMIMCLLSRIGLLCIMVFLLIKIWCFNI